MYEISSNPYFVNNVERQDTESKVGGEHLNVIHFYGASTET